MSYQLLALKRGKLLHYHQHLVGMQQGVNAQPALQMSRASVEKAAASTQRSAIMF